MTNEELEARKKKAASLIVEKTSTGFMVTSATGKGGYQVVSTDGKLSCVCADYYLHDKKDPTWQCKHIIAVSHSLEKSDTLRSRFSVVDI